MQHARANGLDLAWDSVGDERAPAILLITGIGLQMIAWDEAFCRDLAARGFRVIRFDNRDVGRSSQLDAAGAPDPLRVWNELQKHRPVEVPYHLADMAEDAVGLLDALGIRAAHVVGLSMGGMIAQEPAIRHPDRVLSLTSIMSNTGDPNVRGPSFETMMLFLEPVPTDRAAFIAHSVRLFSRLAGPGHPFETDRIRRVAARSFDRGFHLAGVRRQLIAIWTSGSRKAGLARLTVPTLVIHGDADPLVPLQGGRDTAQTIPGARLLVVPGMGHDLPRDVWPLVVDAIAQRAKAIPNP